MVVSIIIFFIIVLIFFLDIKKIYNHDYYRDKDFRKIIGSY